jgi:uncharacterized FlaG/YvyC family protein
MVFGPTRLGLDGSSAARDVSRPRVQDVSKADWPHVSIPASPPPEVLDALDTAARVLEELASRRISLHFEYVEGTHEVKIQVVNESDGSVIREIPPDGLVDIAAGGQAPQAV